MEISYGLEEASNSIISAMRLLKLEPGLVVTLRHMDVNVFLFTFACMNTLPYMLAVIATIDPANYHDLAIIHKPGN